MKAKTWWELPARRRREVTQWMREYIDDLKIDADSQFNVVQRASDLELIETYTLAIRALSPFAGAGRSCSAIAAATLRVSAK